MLIRLGRLKIRQKLQLGFGTLILLIGILAVVTVHNNLDVRRNYQLLAQDAAGVAMREVGPEVAHLVVVALDGRGELTRVVGGQSCPRWQAYQQAAQKREQEIWHGPPEHETIA